MSGKIGIFWTNIQPDSGYPVGRIISGIFLIKVPYDIWYMPVDKIAGLIYQEYIINALKMTQIFAGS